MHGSRAGANFAEVSSSTPWSRRAIRNPPYKQPYSEGCNYRADESPLFFSILAAMLQIDITPFKAGEVHEIELAPPAETLDLDEPDRFSDIEVEARLDVHRDRILVTLQVKGEATLTCDRTLREYQQSLGGTYRVLFGPEHMAGQEGDAFEEVRPLDPSDREIDLTELVRDTLLLAIPQRRIAPGAEEEDIQTEFGVPEEAPEEPVDPRWEKLRELRDDS